MSMKDYKIIERMDSKKEEQTEMSAEAKCAIIGVVIIATIIQVLNLLSGVMV